ncbi:EAL domain-containing protein [Rhizobium sp. PAMB 3174]
MRYSYRLRFWMTFVLLCTTMCAAAWIAKVKLVESANRRTLSNIAETTVSRATLSVDYAIASMGRLLDVDGSSCSEKSRKLVRRVIFETSNLKEVRIREGQLTCWGLNGATDGLDTAIKLAPKVPAANHFFSLFLLNASAWQGLGIRWQLSETHDIIEIINPGTLYDILPPDLRSRANIRLLLSDGTVFARYISSGDFEWRTTNAEVYTATSGRFPIRAEIEVDRQFLLGWQQQIHPAALIGVGLVISILSFFVTRGIVRGKGMADDIDAAIRSGQIRPYYQPIVSISTGEVMGFEALARWIRSDGTLIPPDKFIPFAEETGQIETITHSLLKTAGEDIGEHLRADPRLKMSFNVTPTQFLKAGFASNLLEQFHRNGLPPASMVVEITERQSLGDKEAARRVAEELSAFGVRIAIDDVGTGHNGLSSIHGLGAQYLKIDKYFVDSLTVNKKSLVLIEMMASIAREFGMTVVAEGIETAEQATILARLGITEGQGYHFHRPVPAAQLKSLLTRAPEQGPPAKKTRGLRKAAA